VSQRHRWRGANIVDRPRGRRLLLIALLICVLIGPSVVTADDESPGEARFRWIDAVEAPHPREFPNRLSRRLARYEMAAAASLPTGLAVDFAHYPSSADVLTFLAELEALYPHLVEIYQVGESWQGRPILGLRLGNETAGDPDLRPALYLDGQHHAREAISQQIVLYTVWHLLTSFGTDPLVSHLLNTRTVYAVPSVNVDGNDIWLDEDHTQRRTANPTSSDDDIDSLFDEDPANGMGYGTYQVYRYDFEQDWADDHPDDPFAPGWEAHHLGTEYLGVFDELGSEVPQLDEDQDGLTNEDPVGGVDANRNYDAFWHLGDADPRSPFYRGPTVWSEPEPTAVRDFVLDHAHGCSRLRLGSRPYRHRALLSFRRRRDPAPLGMVRRRGAGRCPDVRASLPEGEPADRDQRLFGLAPCVGGQGAVRGAWNSHGLAVL
jgi:hypothetical protein